MNVVWLLKPQFSDRVVSGIRRTHRTLGNMAQSAGKIATQQGAGAIQSDIGTRWIMLVLLSPIKRNTNCKSYFRKRITNGWCYRSKSKTNCSNQII